MQTDFFKRITNNKEPYIIAEIGANHNGDIELAKKMIDVAKDCGCDAAKFQSWTPKSLISKEEYARNTKYTDSAKKHFGSLEEMVNKYYLREEQHIELNEYCKKVGIHFCSSPFSKPEIDLLVKLDVPFLKIASMDINNLELLRHAARTGKPMVVSTGMSSLSEIENAVKTIEAEGNNEIVLLHCIAIYPPEYEDINLNNIPMLRQTFGYPVGFSDHTIGTSIPLAAAALGSCILEKHFTLDKDMSGWDHEISADPAEMRVIAEEAKNIVNSLGSFQRIVSKDEEEKKTKFRRSVVVNRDLEEGHEITLEDLDYKRPGTGIAPDEVKFLVGKKLTKAMMSDELIQWENLG